MVFELLQGEHPGNPQIQAVFVAQLFMQFRSYQFGLFLHAELGRSLEYRSETRYREYHGSRAVAVFVLEGYEFWVKFSEHRLVERHVGGRIEDQKLDVPSRNPVEKTFDPVVKVCEHKPAVYEGQAVPLATYKGENHSEKLHQGFKILHDRREVYRIRHERRRQRRLELLFRYKFVYPLQKTQVQVLFYRVEIPA